MATNFFGGREPKKFPGKATAVGGDYLVAAELRIHATETSTVQSLDWVLSKREEA